MNTNFINIPVNNTFPINNTFFISPIFPPQQEQKENLVTPVALQKIFPNTHAMQHQPPTLVPVPQLPVPPPGVQAPLSLSKLREFINHNPPLYPAYTQYYPPQFQQPAIFYLPNIGYYALKKTIARSANKTVYEVVDIQKETLMALALIEVTSQNSKQIELEKHYHQKFSQADPQRAHFVAGNWGDFIIDQKLHTAFLMPLMNGGDVGKYLQKNPYTPPKQKMKMFQYMLQSVQTMHHQGIRHGDIKKENYLIGNHPERPKISDFGTCSQSDPSSPAAPNDPKIRSPEHVKYGGLYTGRKGDIWALGVTAAEMFGAPDQEITGLTEAVNSKSNEMIAQKVQLIANRIGTYNYSAAQLVLLCLRAEPQQRPDIDGLIAATENLSKQMSV